MDFCIHLEGASYSKEAKSTETRKQIFGFCVVTSGVRRKFSWRGFHSVT